MDTDQLGTSLLHGFNMGLSIIGITSIVALPASIMMNRYIHHHPLLRLVMAGFGVFMWIGTVIYAIIFMRNQHYFGLFPLFPTVDMNMPKEPTTIWEWPVWIFRWLGSIYKFPLYSLSMGGDPEDKAALLVAMERGLLPTVDSSGQYIPAEIRTEQPLLQGRVHEDFYGMSRSAGANEDVEDWTGMMKLLEKTQIGEVLFGPKKAGEEILRVLTESGKHTFPSKKEEGKFTVPNPLHKGKSKITAPPPASTPSESTESPAPPSASPTLTGPRD
jgi:hypothetical protein